MQYSDGMVVELFDQIDIEIDGRVVEGQITKLHPRKDHIRVGYRDDTDTTRAGDPKWRTITVPVTRVELIARDG